MNNKNIKFEHDYKTLILWFFGTYMIYGPILKFLRSFKIDNLLIQESLFQTFIFYLSSFIGFFGFMILGYFAFYKFYPKQIIGLIISLIITFFFPIFLRYFIEQKLYLWLFGVTNYLENTTFQYYYVDNTYYAVYYIPSGILYYFYKRNQELYLSKMETEKAMISAELSHLRSQLNPHFLFNSLNNIYALALEKSSKIMPAIENLSDLLRYALYEKSKTVAFQKEWEKITKFIELENLRLENPMNLSVEISEEICEVEIPPLIFLPLVENVYKHGEVLSSNGFCHIIAQEIQNNLVFKITNTVSAFKQKDITGGIGIENIKKRLAHYYGQGATLMVSEQGNIYCIEIKIPIKIPIK